MKVGDVVKINPSCFIAKIGYGSLYGEAYFVIKAINHSKRTVECLLLTEDNKNPYQTAIHYFYTNENKARKKSTRS